MMEFYEALSHVYDRLFPAAPRTLSFLTEGLPENARILDVACGTGNYSLALAERGHRVVGVDLDAKMIARAASKPARGTVEFRVGDMTRVGEACPERYDLVFCIGNSLVHAESLDAVRNALTGFAGRLERGRRLVLQIVNFDRVRGAREVELPVLRRKGVTLERRYVVGQTGRTVDFRTVLVVDVGGAARRSEQSVPLLALSSSELKALVEASGFDEVELFGGFDLSGHSADAPATVLRAGRG